MAIVPSMTEEHPIGAGLPDPVHDSQVIFRNVLEAMAHPGRILTLPPLSEARESLAPASMMICLALVDHETPLWLDESLATPGVIAHLAFHTGAPLAETALLASIAVLDGPSTSLARFRTGSDAYPEDGATVIIQVPGLSNAGPLTLSGPGVDGETVFGVEGLPGSFWREREAVNGGFPRGIDIILCDGHRIAALPRTTLVAPRATSPENGEDR